MGFFDVFKKKKEQDPNHALVEGLRELDTSLAAHFSSYLRSQNELHVLQREAGQQFQMVKAKDRDVQTREMERFFRNAYEIVLQQRKIIMRMQETAKKKRFKMWRPLLQVVDKMRLVEAVLRRVLEAHNDPASNRLHAMNQELDRYARMEHALLWPILH